MNYTKEDFEEFIRSMDDNVLDTTTDEWYISYQEAAENIFSAFIKFMSNK